MVAAVRQGRAQREVAQEFGVARATLQWWLKRAGGQPLDQVDWRTRSSAPRRVHNRMPSEVELAVLDCRHRLTATSALGFYGAQSIAETLRAEGTLPQLPSVRTIGRILQRHGVLDGRRRLRRPAPPPGWYVPALHLRQAEVDAFDVIEGLVIEGRGEIDVLTGKALWGLAAVAWALSGVTAHTVLEHVLPYWRQQGLPHFAQFDNDTRFQGGHNHPDVLGRVVSGAADGAQPSAPPIPDRLAPESAGEAAWPGDLSASHRWTRACLPAGTILSGRSCVAASALAL